MSAPQLERQERRPRLCRRAADRELRLAGLSGASRPRPRHERACVLFRQRGQVRRQALRPADKQFRASPPVSATTGHSSAAWRRGQIDPSWSVPVWRNAPERTHIRTAEPLSGQADLSSARSPVERLRFDAPLNKPDPLTFCGEGARGSTDYLMLADVERA